MELDGSNTTVPLGGNYSIRAPGLTGSAERLPGRNLTAGQRTRSRANEETALDDALRAQGMTDQATIELTDLKTVARPGAAVLRSPMGDDALELQTPAPAPDHDAVVLAVDESGAVSWNFPLTNANAIQPATSRGPGQTLRFRIPRTPAVTPPPGTIGQRGLIGTVGKKLLKVLVYPITDIVVGAGVDHFAGRWEEKHRPYRLRTVTRDNYTSANVASIATSDSEQWKSLSSGRALFFIHGTFSTIHGGFGGLAPDDITTLSNRYGGRVFGFDHFTLSHSPARNVDQLVSMIPADAKLDVDIVCHSRGGLVARELVERAQRAGLAGDRFRVGTVVFVGAANAGTVLTNPDHMVHMIDRFTSALNIFPDNFVTDALEIIITAVKVVGHGGLKSLDGLAAMNPGGDYLKELAAQSAGKATYRGITTDFEPNGTPFSKLALANGAVDRIFGDKKNDLVVPTAGVFEAAGPCFPISSADVLELPSAKGVIHTTYFRDNGVRSRLRDWLTGA